MKKILISLSSLYFLLTSLYSQDSQDFGFVLIKSSPINAIVQINAKSTGESTPFQTQLNTGTYSFSLIDPEANYHQYNGQVVVRKNQTTIIEAILLPNFGSVHIESNPTSARIMIDGVFKGITPATISNLKSGKHLIKLIKSNYNSLEREFEIEDEKTTQLSLDLFAGFGTIGILAKPREAGIFIDGEYKMAGLYSGKLSAGIHEIEIKLKGYSSKKELVTIGQGEEKRLQFEIKPMLGSISIMVEPPETGVYLNGEYKGLSPLIISDLVVGTYKLELKKEAYVYIKKSVEVQENKLTLISEKMSKGYMVSIESNPSQASIFLQNSRIGVTPQKIPLPAGFSILTLEKLYYQKSETTVNPSYQDQVFNIELKRLKNNVDIQTNIPGAKISLSAKKTDINSGLNYNKSSTSSFKNDIPRGEYFVTVENSGYKTIKDEFILDALSFKKNYILHPEQYRIKSNAMLRSLVWPGSGQSYLNRGSKEYLFGIIGWGALGFGIYQNIQAVDYYDRYVASVDIDERTEFKEAYQKHETVSTALYISAGVIWGVNLLWTAMIPSEMSRLRKLELTGYVDPDSNEYLVGLRLPITDRIK